MITNSSGAIDYDEHGAGPTIVFVPGSCSTGAAWRPVIAELDGRFRCITTSLPGYGGTMERRTNENPSIGLLAETLESVIAKAGCPVHLVGHSFGGLVSLAAALRDQSRLASLAIFEAPATQVLPDRGEYGHYQSIRRMTEGYFTSYRNGNADAIAAMIDFYGGAGTFSSWPQRVRDYAMKTTRTNLLDWHSAFQFPLPATMLAALDVPTLVVVGESSNPAIKRANDLLSRDISGAPARIIPGAAHFMIATHVPEVARLVEDHALRSEALRAAA